MNGFKMLKMVLSARQTRSFAVSRAASSDIISQLYLTELKSYKPSTAKVESGLPETFAMPAAPEKPKLERFTAKTDNAELGEAVWPDLVDPIDDPKNYNDEWDFRTDTGSGDLLPRPLKPVHYDDH